jgi:hypothetical protein
MGNTGLGNFGGGPLGLLDSRSEEEWQANREPGESRAAYSLRKSLEDLKTNSKRAGTIALGTALGGLTGGPMGAAAGGIESLIDPAQGVVGTPVGNATTNLLEKLITSSIPGARQTQTVSKLARAANTTGRSLATGANVTAGGVIGRQAGNVAKEQLTGQPSEESWMPNVGEIISGGLGSILHLMPWMAKKAIKDKLQTQEQLTRNGIPININNVERQLQQTAKQGAAIGSPAAASHAALVAADKGAKDAADLMQSQYKAAQATTRAERVAKQEAALKLKMEDSLFKIEYGRAQRDLEVQAAERAKTLTEQLEQARRNINVDGGARSVIPQLEAALEANAKALEIGQRRLREAKPSEVNDVYNSAFNRFKEREAALAKREESFFNAQEAEAKVKADLDEKQYLAKNISATTGQMLKGLREKTNQKLAQRLEAGSDMGLFDDLWRKRMQSGQDALPMPVGDTYEHLRAGFKELHGAGSAETKKLDQTLRTAFMRDLIMSAGETPGKNKEKILAATINKLDSNGGYETLARVLNNTDKPYASLSPVELKELDGRVKDFMNVAQKVYGRNNKEAWGSFQSWMAFDLMREALGSGGAAAATIAGRGIIAKLNMEDIMNAAAINPRAVMAALKKIEQVGTKVAHRRAVAVRNFAKVVGAPLKEDPMTEEQYQAIMGEKRARQTPLTTGDPVNSATDELDPTRPF